MSGCIKFTDEYSTQPKFNRIVISALFLLSGFFVPLLLMGYADMFGKIGIIYACILKICTSFFTSFAIPNEFSKMFIDPSDIIGSVARLYLLSACISIFPVGGSSAQEILFTLIEGRFKSRIFTRNRMCGIFFMLGIPFFTVYFSILCCLLILS